MKTFPRCHRAAAAAAAAAALVIGLGACAMFRDLGADLRFMAQTSIITARVTNAADHPNVRGLVMEWDRDRGAMRSADYARVEGVGLFGFFVKSRANQYVAAFSDRNGSGSYDPGEPAWIHADPGGRPTPVVFGDDGKARVKGALAATTVLPPDLIAAGRQLRGGRDIDAVVTGWRIPVALGTVADLDDPRFAAATGSEGLWRPASFPMEKGLGIYFLEPYDPGRVPVLFVYGAAGSPQDWRPFFRQFDRRRYQLWFYQYPSGRHLDEMGEALDRGLEVLQSFHGFRQVHVVAHSMGGLVARHAILRNLAGDRRWAGKFVSISSPYGGHEFAGVGVKHAPAVVPSWIDMEIGSRFQQELFKGRLKGAVDHLLIYGDKAKRSLLLPPANDGTVSVASVTRPEAVRDAARVERFAEDHLSILANPAVIRRVEGFLAE